MVTAYNVLTPNNRASTSSHRCLLLARPRQPAGLSLWTDA